MGVKEVKVLSNKFWIWKEKGWKESLLVSMNSSMVCTLSVISVLIVIKTKKAYNNNKVDISQLGQQYNQICH